jgi:hypothetical protein
MVIGTPCRLLAFLVIVRRSRIEFPAPPVSRLKLAFAFELFGVLILDADSSPDVIHNILVGSRVVAAWRFIADGRGRLPVGIHIAAGHFGTGIGKFLRVMMEPRAARARGTGGSVQVQRGGWRRDGIVVVFHADCVFTIDATVVQERQDSVTRSAVGGLRASDVRRE